MDDQYYNEADEAENHDDVHTVLTEDDAMTPEQRDEVQRENARRASLTSEQKEDERRRRAEEKRVVHEEMKKEREQRKIHYEEKMKQKEEKKKLKQEKKMKSNHKLKAGQPFLRTFHITEGGWYRLCVTAENGEVCTRNKLNRTNISFLHHFYTHHFSSFSLFLVGSTNGTP
jgi:flagellar biosynthesis GTPase FlhF